MLSKECSRCGISKSLNEFSPNRGGKFGRKSWCKICARNYRKSHSKELKEINGYKKVHSKLCKECLTVKPIEEFFKRSSSNDGHESYCMKCNVEMNKKARLKLKDDILIGYGSKCNCCGELTKEFLQIDHIFNDGAEERKSKNYGEVYKLWRKLRKLGYPKDRYQILCANCNWAKGFYGECPHKKNKEIVCQSN